MSVHQNFPQNYVIHPVVLLRTASCCTVGSSDAMSIVVDYDSLLHTSFADER